MTQKTYDNTSLSSAEELSVLAQEVADHFAIGLAALTQKSIELALDHFQAASELQPDNTELHFQQGLALYECGTEEGQEKILLLASKKFKLATKCDSSHFLSWQMWGTTLSFLGKTFDETHYFLEAEKKFSKALELSEHQKDDLLHDLYFEYAIVKAELAERLGEAYDWQQSIQAFEKASSYTTSPSAEFWNYFGVSCLSVYQLIGDTKMCVKGIHCFKQALVLDDDYYEGWENLSKAMHALYDITHDEDHFFQANECFAKRAHRYPTEASLWLDWSLFLLQNGKTTQDTKKLYSAVEKANKANSIEEPIPTALACAGEALSLIGEFSEKIELIYEGQNKILEAIESVSDDPFLWKALGESYNCLGRYFEEQDYLYLAIEKFQEGLSIDRTAYALWFASANSYTILGKMLEDVPSLEQALHFYEKAIALQPRNSQYYFTYGYCLSLLGEISGQEQWLEKAIAQFEKALFLQKNATYLHPDWLFQYAKALDLYADFFEEEYYYHKAIEIFSHVLMIDPDFPQIHYHMALAQSHLGELSEEKECFYKALHFFKLAVKHDAENDQILIDLGVTLINIAQHTGDTSEIRTCYQEAEVKFIQAAKAGNLQAYYQLACLFSLLGNVTQAVACLFKADTFNALPALDDLLEDEWLEQARCSEPFQELLFHLEKKAGLQGEI